MISRMARSLAVAALIFPFAKSHAQPGARQFNFAWDAEPAGWQKSGSGLAMKRLTNAGPVIFTVVRIELDRLNNDLSLITTLASNQVVGTEPLATQLQRIAKTLGNPVTAMNGDFFMMSGAAKGDPRGLHIWRGELVSVPTGPAAFWRDAKGRLHGEPVSSRLTVSWPGGGTNLCGLNEQLRTNSMVLFTPRMGHLNEDRTTDTGNATPANRSSRAGPNSEIPQGGPIRTHGGREFTLEHSGTGPWLPLRVGQTYHARVAAHSDGFTGVPPGKMLLMLGSNFLARSEVSNVPLPSKPPLTNPFVSKSEGLEGRGSDASAEYGIQNAEYSALRTPHSLTDPLSPLTDGTPITITVATDPDLSGVQEALGTGPMLVRQGKLHEVTARMSQQLHPRAALGWNRKYLYLATADGRQKEISVGIKLSEMADFMIELGCDEAINMDGGQSTTLILDGAVINQPTKGRHDVANGIAVVRKRTLENPED